MFVFCGQIIHNYLQVIKYINVAFFSIFEMISSKTLDAFYKSLNLALKEADLSKFSYVGLIGSAINKKSQKDIDIFTLKSADSKIGEAIIANYELIDSIDRIMNKDYGFVITPFPNKSSMNEVEYIVGLNNNPKKIVLTHNLFFPDEASVMSKNPINFYNSIKKNKIDVYGDMSLVNPVENISDILMEQYFWLVDYNLPFLENKYPDDLQQKKMSDVLGYLNKNYGANISLVNMNSSDRKKIFFDLLSEFDKAA